MAGKNSRFFRVCQLSVLLITLAVFMLSSPMVQAQEEGMRGVGRVNAPTAVEQGRNLLFVIGINDYAKWFVLENAVQDAETLEAVLSQQYGFTPALPALLNEAATHDNILGHLDQLRRELEPDDNLIIFFAGHGCTRTDSVGQRVVQRGYIVPVDGAPLAVGQWSTYISVEEFMREVALLPARHITLILDACHSGIALGDGAASFRGTEEGPPLSLVGKTSRRVITSAMADQLASDQGSTAGNSLFTETLARGLRYGQVDLDSDGLITTSEIGLFLQREVRKRSGDLQTPDFGAFALDERGEMVLEAEATSPAVLRNNAFAQLRSSQAYAFLETFERLRQMDSGNLEFLYLESVYHVLKGNIQKAIAALEERSLLEEERIEENRKPLYIEERQEMVAGLRRWGGYLRPIRSEGHQQLDIRLLAGESDVLPDSSTYLGALAYSISLDLPYQLRVTNTSDQPLYIYAIHINSNVKIRPLLLWNDLGLLWKGGLPPGASANSSIFKPAEFEGFEIIRLVLSKERIKDFVFPVDINAEDEPVSKPEHLVVQNLWLTFK